MLSLFMSFSLLRPSVHRMQPTCKYYTTESLLVNTVPYVGRFGRLVPSGFGIYYLHV